MVDVCLKAEAFLRASFWALILTLWGLLATPLWAHTNGAVGGGMDFPIFISLDNPTGPQNSVGVHLFAQWENWSFRVGWRFAFVENTPFSSTQSYVANPTLYNIDGNSGLTWAELAFGREFPFVLNPVITVVPSLGVVWEPRLTGTAPSYASGQEESPLFAEASLAFRLSLKNDFYLSPEFRYGWDVLSMNGQQVLFGVELGYAYGR